MLQTWRTAVQATLHCLTGCAIGEVAGMALGTAASLAAAQTVILAIVLAFVCGYGLTIRPLLRNGATFKAALKLALAADSISIITMELMDNTVMVAIPGALTAELRDGLFWLSLTVSLAAAFVVTVPVNRWLIARGRGHAVMHHHH